MLSQPPGPPAYPAVWSSNTKFVSKVLGRVTSEGSWIVLTWNRRNVYSEHELLYTITIHGYVLSVPVRFLISVLTSWSLLRSKMRILGRQATVKVTRLSMTPLSRTQSLLHLSILVLNTLTIPEQFSRVGFPEAAFTCHSQLGKGCKPQVQRV